MSKRFISIRRLAYRIAYFGWKILKRFFLKETEGSQVVVRYNNKILLVKTCYRKTYSFPGGYVNRGELPKEAGIRELCEETGLTLEFNTVNFKCRHSVIQNGTECSDNFFEARLEHDPSIHLKIDNVEIIEASFFELEYLSQLDLDYNVIEYIDRFLNNLTIK